MRKLIQEIKHRSLPPVPLSAGWMTQEVFVSVCASVSRVVSAWCGAWNAAWYFALRKQGTAFIYLRQDTGQTNSPDDLFGAPKSSGKLFNVCLAQEPKREHWLTSPAKFVCMCVCVCGSIRREWLWGWFFIFAMKEAIKLTATKARLVCSSKHGVYLPVNGATRHGFCATALSCSTVHERRCGECVHAQTKQIRLYLHNLNLL